MLETAERDGRKLKAENGIAERQGFARDAYGL